jgi:hypothetical protein
VVGRNKNEKETDMNIHSHVLGKRAASILALSLALALTGCGGGGGSPGATGGNSGDTGSGGTTTPASPTVSVAFTNSSGQSTNSLTGATQLTARATVRDAAGKAVPNALVTFATDNNLAVFSPSAGTALTDANGVASITMRPANLAAGGAGTVTVTTSVNGTNITGTANYSVGATALTFGTLSANPASIQAYGSTVLSVDLLAGNAKYTDQQVNVNFSSACVSAGKASLATVVATNNGTAQTVYRDQGCGNNDTITVSAAGVATPATAQLTIAAPAAASMQFEQATPSGQSIVIQGQGGNGRTETASLKFKVMDIFNHPLPGATVDFASSTTAVTVNKASDTTDQNGEVITTVNSGSTATSFRIKAALHANPNVFTWSDSIVVTTGLPVQRAFSLSAGQYNLDATVESNPSAPATHLQAMIADQFGNPVPDGTPVVFQTNMGSVGSSSQGGCITTNGGCSVDFRMQDPRVVTTPNSPATPCNAASNDSTRPGVATVCASTTDGTNTVFKKIALFFSLNTPSKVYMDGSATPLAGVTDLGTLASNGTRVFTLQLNDANANPLPAGTTVTIASPVNVTVAAPLPNVVPNIAPHSLAGDDITGVNVSGPQGSTHSITVSSPQAANCTTALSSSFNVAVTTPAGLTTYIPFKLAFSCP